MAETKEMDGTTRVMSSAGQAQEAIMISDMICTDSVGNEGYPTVAFLDGPTWRITLAGPCRPHAALL